MYERELKYSIMAAKEALAHMINRNRWLKNAVVVNEPYRQKLLKKYRLDILHLTNEVSNMQTKLFKIQRNKA